jgi:hypothetical protein
VRSSISTDQFGSKVFRPHGRAEYEDRGKLLLARASGPFNSELMAAVLEMAKITFPAMTKKGPWAHICTFSKSALCSLEVLSDLAGALGQMVQAGVAPEAMAFVLPADVEGSTLMSPLYEKALRDVGVPFKCFSEVGEAYVWVESFVEPLNKTVDK